VLVLEALARDCLECWCLGGLDEGEREIMLFIGKPEKTRGILRRYSVAEDATCIGLA